MTIEDIAALRDSRAWLPPLLLLLALSCLFPAVSYAQTRNTCIECHSLLDPPLRVTQEDFSQDIHSQKGLTCAACHGGDPTSDDPNVAMGRAAGFRGKIEHNRVPEVCAKCHSDVAYMRQFNPSLRTDQLSQYRTSVHGRRLAQGDARVAVCTDCHGLHNIRPASDSRSRVHPLNVAETCARCHADSQYMKSYGIPTDQYAKYKASVHHEALVVRGDLSAPTCTTCHGNHGATPPGVASVEFVCSTCHAFQAQLFDQSPHKDAFTAMSLPGCVTCHENHRIVHPTDALLATNENSLCGRCHSSGDPGFEGAQTMHAGLARLQAAMEKSDEVLGQAERSGMEVSQARLAESQARDALTKARVTIHSFTPARVAADVQEGLKVSHATLEAGMQALAERDYRRKGLGITVFAIIVVLIGLWLWIREIESKKGSA